MMELNESILGQIQAREEVIRVRGAVKNIESDIREELAKPAYRVISDEEEKERKAVTGGGGRGGRRGRPTSPA